MIYIVIQIALSLIRKDYPGFKEFFELVSLFNDKIKVEELTLSEFMIITDSLSFHSLSFDSLRFDSDGDRLSFESLIIDSLIFNSDSDSD